MAVLSFSAFLVCDSCKSGHFRV